MKSKHTFIKQNYFFYQKKKTMEFQFLFIEYYQISIKSWTLDDPTTN